MVTFILGAKLQHAKKTTKKLFYFFKAHRSLFFLQCLASSPPPFSNIYLFSLVSLIAG